MTDPQRDPAASGEGTAPAPGTAEEAAGVLGSIQDVQATADVERPALDDAIAMAAAVDAQREAEAAADAAAAEAAAAEPQLTAADLEVADEADPGTELGFLDEAEDDIEHVTEGDAEADEVSPPIDTAVAAAATVDAAHRGRKGQGARTQAPAAPSVSDKAVHVDDRFSAYFVIGLVGLFVAIVLAALLIGPGSLLGNVLKSAPTPAPIESVAPSVEPSASVEASAAPSVEASPSAAASAAPSDSPAASPEASPSPSAS